MNQDVQCKLSWQNPPVYEGNYWDDYFIRYGSLNPTNNGNVWSIPNVIDSSSAWPLQDGFPCVNLNPLLISLFIFRKKNQ